jgi:hypothetical protein
MEEQHNRDHEGISPETLIAIHKEVFKGFTCNKNLPRHYKYDKVRRTVSSRNDKGTNLLEYTEERVTKNGITFYPELLEYIFYLEGIPKKLFLFLVFYYVNPKTNEFLFNPHTIKDFNNFCDVTGQKTHTETSVKQALEALKKTNIVVSRNRGIYMLNPVIAGGESHDARKRLIIQYSNLLSSKNKDVIIDFYPVYNLKDSKKLK